MSKNSVWFMILPFALALGAGQAADERPKGKAATGYRTPFGVLHSDGKAAEGQAKPQPPVGFKVTEEGDSLRFERPSPFGVRKWTRKKTELTGTEKAAWELEKSSQGPQSGKSKE
ncbi:MAG: hypothetical protein Q8N47_00980 [Bryobacterales bacterium]|nr:hypothetical protein [Bryobacterales bacterium]